MLLVSPGSSGGEIEKVGKTAKETSVEDPLPKLNIPTDFRERRFEQT